MEIPSRNVKSYDEEYDVVVVGYGYAGGIAAVEAASAGAKVLLLEKTSVPGGISICSYGAVRCAKSKKPAFDYLKATNGGRTPDDVIRVLADGMAEMEGYVRELASVNGSTVSTTEEYGKGANYPLPGCETFYHTNIDWVPNFDARAVYPWAVGAPGGPRTFKVVADNVDDRGIDVRFNTRVLRLITNGASNEVVGVTAENRGEISRVRARRGVILATGGFEGSDEFREQFWEGTPVLPAAARHNTGDGIRMAQDVGAALWHMWHFHGAYGFKHSDPDYPYAIRVKRLPDWMPGREVTADVKMAWILLDQSGRRYMNEYQPYTQDTTQRPLHYFDPVTQTYPRNPSLLVCDEKGCKMYPLGRPTSNDEGIHYEWSDDNLKEVESGVLKRANSLVELADMLEVDRGRMTDSIKRWNEACARGKDDDFGRPAGTMTSIDTPPFYGAPVWCVVSNTQGGPVHDAKQRIVDSFGRAVPRLFSVGELGSSFGHLYMSGGNIAECFVTGRVAGRNAAGLSTS
ncbi:MAG TPA: FAD-dependent oxidoreductase [Xanthobacteraceae bacterium]|jgi:succinate dehydrogenase/fumarate reductase flavoprotein subunit